MDEKEHIKVRSLCYNREFNEQGECECVAWLGAIATLGAKHHTLQGLRSSRLRTKKAGANKMEGEQKIRGF